MNRSRVYARPVQALDVFARLGISVQPTRPFQPADKSTIDRLARRFPGRPS